MEKKSNSNLQIPSSAEIREESRRMQKRARRGRIAWLILCLCILLLALVFFIFSLSLRRSFAEETTEETQTEETVQSETALSEDSALSEIESSPTDSPEDAAEPSEKETGETAASEEEPDSSVTGTVDVDTYLYLRSGGGMDNEIIGHLLPDDQVVVLEEEDGWYKVIVSEVVGYVCGDYLDVEEEEERK